jgi:hypothetical protein
MKSVGSVLLACLVAGLGLAGGAGGAAAQAATQATATVVGVVADSAMNRLGGAEIRYVIGDSIARIARTDASGRFQLVVMPVTHARLRVRRLGFDVQELALVFPRQESDTLRITLVAGAALIDAVTVHGEERGFLKDFDERRRSNSFGRYFTRDEIAVSRKNQASEVLRQVPGVTLLALRPFGHVVRMRGCRARPLIYIDGMRLPGAEIDDVIRPDDIAGMEVYKSPAGVPAQFMDRENSGCGTILIWTRIR